MGRLARRSQRGGSDTFELTSCLVEGMGVRLGLKEPEDAVLLRDLADEFREWLRAREDKIYVAGWGIIGSDSYDPEYLYFKPLTLRVAGADGSAAFSPRAGAVSAAMATLDAEPS